VADGALDPGVRARVEALLRRADEEFAQGRGEVAAQTGLEAAQLVAAHRTWGVDESVLGARAYIIRGRSFDALAQRDLKAGRPPLANDRLADKAFGDAAVWDRKGIVCPLLQIVVRYRGRTATYRAMGDETRAQQHKLHVNSLIDAYSKYDLMQSCRAALEAHRE
jgi:hypothetical protein